jgi:hypothetical protein
VLRPVPDAVLVGVLLEHLDEDLAVVGVGVHHGQVLDRTVLVHVVAHHVAQPQQRLLAGAGLGGLLDLTGAQVEHRLDGQDAAGQRLGAADAAALLQVVEGVEGAVHPRAVGLVLDGGDDLVGGGARSGLVGGRHHE